MVFKGLMAAVTAAALVASPTVAMAQQSGIVSRAVAAEATPAGETVEGESDMMQRRRRGIIIPLVAITLVILAIIIIFDDNDGPPASP